MSILRRSQTAALVLQLCVSAHASAQGTTQPDLSGDDPHWKKIATSDCWLYDPGPRAGSTVEWSGQCIGRVASGHGTEIWKDYAGNTTQTVALTLVNGVGQGPAKISFTVNGNATEVMNVPMTNGAATGQGTMSLFRDGKKIQDYAGSFVDGKISGQGRLTTYNADGAVIFSANQLWANGKPVQQDNVATAPVAGTSGSAHFALSSGSARPAASSISAAPSTGSAQSPPPDIASEIADIANYDKSLPFALKTEGPYGVGTAGYQDIVKDPTASNLDTKLVIADSFDYRSFMIQDDPADPRSSKYVKDAWRTNLSSLNDLAAARRWYQLVLDQARQLYPGVDFSNPRFDYAQTKKVPLFVYIWQAAQAFPRMPDEATLASVRSQLEQEQRQAQLKEAQEKKIAADKKAAFRAALPGLLAQRKEVGDTVCDSELALIGQVERVEHDKIQVRQHLHRDFYRSALSAAKVGAEDWDTLDWIAYNRVIKCDD